MLIAMAQTDAATLPQHNYANGPRRLSIRICARERTTYEHPFTRTKPYPPPTHLAGVLSAIVWCFLCV
jgi:hypothetical protein